MDKHHQQQHHQQQLPITPPLSNISMTPPHSNENVPPDEALQVCKSNLLPHEEGFESKHVADAGVQPLMENNMQQNDGFAGMYGQNVVQQFEKVDDVKMKKVSTRRLCKGYDN